MGQTCSGNMQMLRTWLTAGRTMMLIVLALSLSGSTGAAADAVAEANSLNQQAIHLYQTGHYAEAEPLLKRSLAILEKTLGPEDPKIAALLSNLAELYDAEGRYADVEPLYKRSLAIREKALGPEHPYAISNLN